MTIICEGVDLTLDGNVAVLTLDFPPVNAMSPSLIDGLYDGMTAALDDASVEAIVLICAGRTFIAGADLRTLGKVEPKVDFFVLQDIIENAPKQTVCALHGTALGGGLEVAMTFQYRIAVPSARMGLPEATLGLLPGGGGTQRLPRIVGAAVALDLLISGRQTGAREALAIGLIDRLADEAALRRDAVAFARELAAAGAPPRRIRDLEDRIASDRADPGFFARYRAEHQPALAGLDAPQAVVRCVEAAVAGPWYAGIAVERAEFQKVLHGPQSAALRHVFMAERAAQKLPGLAAGTQRPPIRSVGLVGTGSLADAIAPLFRTAGIEVTHTADLAALADVDLIVAVGDEDAAATRAMFVALDAIVRPDAILATVHSDIDAIASTTRHAERVLGLHFAAPVATVRLLEIVRGAQTTDAVLATAVSLAKTLGKAPVVLGIGAGPIADRLRAIGQAQADALVATGVSPERIERVLADFGFSDVTFTLAGDSGHHAPAGTMTDDAVLTQMLLPMIAEGIRVLEIGIAQRGSDIDLACVMGFGWPAHRGGPMFHADTLGLTNVRDAIAAMPDVPPSALLRQLADDGGSLAAFRR